MRPLIFAACERVIVDANGHGVTLVQLIDRINIDARNLDIPADVMFSMSWHAFVMWLREDSPPGKYEQLLSLINEAGATLFEVPTQIDFQTPTHHAITIFRQFPAAVGNYGLQLTMKLVGHEKGSIVGYYPIRVVYNEPIPGIGPGFEGGNVGTLLSPSDPD